MEKRKIHRQLQQAEEMWALSEIKSGKKGFKKLLMSKAKIVNRVTELDANIRAADQEIECLALLHKIVVL